MQRLHAMYSRAIVELEICRYDKELRGVCDGEGHAGADRNSEKLKDDV